MFSLATFNLKDLFVPAQPSSIWPQKLAEVARRIQRASADVVALQEVGGQGALDALLEHLGAPWHGICAPSCERGIACAVVAKVPFSETRIHHERSLPFPRFVAEAPPPFDAQIGLRRPIVEVVVPFESSSLHFFSIHLKSNLPRALRREDGSWVAPSSPKERTEGYVRSLVLRAAEALYVRGLVDTALTTSRQVAVAGDFNDVPGSLPLRIVMGEDEDALSSVIGKVAEHKRYSAFHRGKPQLIDHMLVSTRLGERLVRADLDLEGLRDHGPLVRKGAEYVEAEPTIDSDHALLSAQFA